MVVVGISFSPRPSRFLIIFEINFSMASLSIGLFLNEILIRLLNTVILVLYSLELLSFYHFMILFVCCYALVALISFGYLLKHKKVTLNFSDKFCFQDKIQDTETPTDHLYHHHWV